MGAHMHPPTTLAQSFAMHMSGYAHRCKPLTSYDAMFNCLLFGDIPVQTTETFNIYFRTMGFNAEKPAHELTVGRNFPSPPVSLAGLL